jgi:predicted ATPase
VDRLPDDERSVLELASVEGTGFHPDAVAELAGAAVDAQLASLVRKELLRPREGEQSFAFRHQLVRDAAYDSMPKQLRAELHEQLAEWLRPRACDEIAEYHLDRAAGLRRELDVRTI